MTAALASNGTQLNHMEHQLKPYMYMHVYIYVYICVHIHINTYIHTGVGKSRFTVVRMENTIITPWLVWLSGLSASLQTKGSPV